MAKRKKTLIPKTLLFISIITGVAWLVFRILNRRVQMPGIGEIAGYAGTAFAVSVVIIIGIWLVSAVNER